MSTKHDLTGMTFGRLTVIKEAEKRYGKTHWIVQCSCGSEPKSVASFSLVGGKTVSCGCWRKEAMAAGRAGQHAGTHGLSNTPEYETWRAMIRRCTNPEDRSFTRYGGRGISVCDRWLSSFEDFLADVGKRPHPSLTLDRIDNDGNYEPGNVRWATVLEQAKNTRTYKHGLSNLTRAQLIEIIQRERAERPALLAAAEAVERVRAIPDEPEWDIEVLLGGPQYVSERIRAALDQPKEDA